jgi:hypothetical protein
MTTANSLVKRAIVLTLTALAALGCAKSAAPIAYAATAAPIAWQDCRPVRLHLDGLSIETTDCRYSTGHWRVQVEPGLPGLVLWAEDARIDTVLQLFQKRPEDGIDAILPTLRAQGHIPDDDDCRFVPLATQPVARTRALFEIRPFGARQQRLAATPADEVPDPPCGAMGWSTHGVRYFMTDLRRPDRVVFINLGQDGTQIDPASIEWGAGE